MGVEPPVAIQHAAPLGSVEKRGLLGARRAVSYDMVLTDARLQLVGRLNCNGDPPLIPHVHQECGVLNAVLQLPAVHQPATPHHQRGLRHVAVLSSATHHQVLDLLGLGSAGGGGGRGCAAGQKPAMPLLVRWFGRVALGVRGRGAGTLGGGCRRGRCGGGGRSASRGGRLRRLLASALLGLSEESNSLMVVPKHVANHDRVTPDLHPRDVAPHRRVEARI
mmetsp:Transcript_8180/g.19561  ORF Transcript_8180/g.19561 Transcript_8180/m.19561 type:complete len:221 (+) Transcript_8180:438-1100(+)